MEKEKIEQQIEKNNVEKQKPNTKNNKEILKTKRFKQEYFDFYDDIKDFSKGKEDW